jgi:hypothetical protein
VGQLRSAVAGAFDPNCSIEYLFRQLAVFCQLLFYAVIFARVA